MFNEIKEVKNIKNDLVLGITNPLIAKVVSKVVEMYFSCVEIRPRV